MNLVCWGLFAALLALPVSVNLVSVAARRALPQTFSEVEFVYFYGMGRVFNQYPADKVYDIGVEQRVFNQIHRRSQGNYGPVPYAPFLGVLLRPLAILPFFTAYLVWMVISCSLYLGGIALLTWRFFPRDPWRRSLIFCFALCFYPFTGWTLPEGCLSTIGFFSVSWSLREEEMAHPFRSGLALSICSYKPSLLLLLVPMLVVTRRFRTLAGVVAGCSFLALFATLVEGPRAWVGYFELLTAFATTSAEAQSHVFKQVWKYVDLASFTSLLPAGRTWPGVAIFAALAAWAAFALVRLWWKSAGVAKPAGTMVWATTLTWTLLLSIYIPIYDSILVVPSVIATAAVLLRGGPPEYCRWFTWIWVFILATSWITISLAERYGIQILSVAFAALGILQLALARKMILAPGQPAPAGPQYAPSGAAD